MPEQRFRGDPYRVLEVGHAASDAQIKRRWRDLAREHHPDRAAGDGEEAARLTARMARINAAYDVLREEGTERPGTSPLNAEKQPGVFVCAGCDLPLFTSAMKYESGTGWPSFFTTIPGAFGTRRDFKLLLPRTEYHCVRCGGHHGHLFDDGPPPTGQRWCNNGVALRFVPKARNPV